MGGGGEESGIGALGKAFPGDMPTSALKPLPGTCQLWIKIGSFQLNCPFHNMQLRPWGPRKLPPPPGGRGGGLFAPLSRIPAPTLSA